MKFTRLLLFVFTIAFVAGACSDAKEVNIYSARHYDTDLELYEKFTEQTGIKVNLLEGRSDELIERISSEGTNSPADILITVDAGRLWRAKEAGIFQPLDSEMLTSLIPAELRDRDDMWVGFSKRTRGIVYHKDRVDPANFRGYRELTDEQWRGRLCIRSSNNIYNQSLVASAIETYGVEATEAWAAGMVANFARSPQGGDTDQIRAVAAGECDIAVVNHYYLARLMASEREEDQQVAAAVDMYFPSAAFGGTHVNISGAGITANAPNRDHAIAFLEFLATEEAQAIYAIANNEFPILTDMEVSGVLGDFTDFDTDAVNVTSYGENNPEAIRLMDRVNWP
ncbi:MAG: ABC-type iron(III) uptake system substrate-binding component FbpA [Bacteroidetes bacterium HLUCCA01]|nr:MAG: ABC-type iron(III) uptake system substrate-binding component FbpA [Bacteroidetes bacterium HLUCCA01]